jgi:hypothetical protein
MKKALLFVLMFLLLCTAAWAGNGLVLTITSDKAKYKVGETIKITAVLENTSNQPFKGESKTDYDSPWAAEVFNMLGDKCKIDEGYGKGIHCAPMGISCPPKTIELAPGEKVTTIITGRYRKGTAWICQGPKATNCAQKSGILLSFENESMACMIYQIPLSGEHVIKVFNYEFSDYPNKPSESNALKIEVE